MKLIDFANSFCAAYVAYRSLELKTIKRNVFRQKIICRGDLYDGKNLTYSAYLQHACGGEDVYQQTIFFEPTYTFTTIFYGDKMKCVRIVGDDIDLTELRFEAITEIGADKLYKKVQIKQVDAEYEELDTTEKVISAVLNGREMIGITEYSRKGGRWVITYPINYINVELNEKLYQVDAGDVLFLDTIRGKEDMFLSYVGYSNVKPDTEFLIYYDHDPNSRYYSAVRSRQAINKLYAKVVCECKS